MIFAAFGFITPASRRSFTGSVRRHRYPECSTSRKVEILMHSMHTQSQQLDRQGLSTQEVEERRARGLGCVPPPLTGRSYLRIFRENVLN